MPICQNRALTIWFSFFLSAGLSCFSYWRHHRRWPISLTAHCSSLLAPCVPETSLTEPIDRMIIVNTFLGKQMGDHQMPNDLLGSLQVVGKSKNSITVCLTLSLSLPLSLCLPVIIRTVPSCENLKNKKLIC